MRIYLLLLLSILPIFGGELNTLTPEEKNEGWKLLFNGKDLTGWRVYASDKAPLEGWQIENGILIKKNGIEGGHIVTEETFSDYILSWEWKIEKFANSGIKYLVTEERPKTPGPEYQMIDNATPVAAMNKKHKTASLYDIIPAPKDSGVKPIGQWNHSKIIVRGNQVEHWLNGKTVLSYELGSDALQKALSRSKFRKSKDFGKKIDGHLMLTDHQTECAFRNIKIRPL